MVTYVLDSSAILRYLDDEAGAERVAEIIKSHLAGGCVAAVSALHWGDVAGITCKLHGRPAMELVLSRLSAFGLPVIAADADRAVRSSLIKLKKGDSLRGRLRNRTGVRLARSRFRDRGLRFQTGEPRRED
jgi:PIN domain nuclease of toxin-antitoxin system